MALLTAEDVLNKAFSKTKYREGFDQDEVDDYLDDVAHTIQSLTAERDALAQQLEAARAQGGLPASAPLPSAAPSIGQQDIAGAQTPTAMMAMAQKLHDEYVTSGQEEKERLIQEARTQAQQIIADAESDAKGKAREATEQAERDRADLEQKIDDLRRFERDYRTRLKGYLENLLGDLDHLSSDGTGPQRTL